MQYFYVGYNALYFPHPFTIKHFSKLSLLENKINSTKLVLKHQGSKLTLCNNNTKGYFREAREKRGEQKSFKFFSYGKQSLEVSPFLRKGLFSLMLRNHPI